MKRLAVILPYNEQHIENFTEHFKATIKENTDFYYKLVFLKQKSNRPVKLTPTIGSQFLLWR